MPENVDEQVMVDLFTSGKAAIIIAGPWEIPTINESDIDYGITGFPTVDETGQALSPFVGVQGLTMTSTCKDKEAAKKVIQLLCKKEVSEAFALQLGSAPASEEAYENEEVKKNEMIIAARNIEHSSEPMPNVQEMSLVWGYAYKALLRVMGNQDIDTVLMESDKELQKEIAAFKSDNDGGQDYEN